MITKKYSHIIFDLGGVVLDINYQNTIDKFIELGIPNFDKIYTQAKQNNMFDLYEEGKINESEFIDYIKSLIKTQVCNKDIVFAWNCMLGHISKNKKSYLEKLSKHFNLILLSNTNETHLNKFKSDIVKDYKDYWIPNCFSEIYYSHEIGLRKPNKEVFEFVLNQNHINKNEVVFFDDSIQHIEGAQSIGINSFLVSKYKPFEYYLSEFLF